MWGSRCLYGGLVALLLFVHALAQVDESPEVCSLCNYDSTLEVFEPNTIKSFNFFECCPLQYENQSDCVIDPVAPSRFEGISASLLGSRECLEGEKLIMENFQFSQSFNTSCCVSCSCHGDPECISFDGVMDKWVICDARQDNNDGEEGNCPLKRKVCEQQLDPAGNQCKWFTVSETPDGQSQCRPWNPDANEMALFPLLMYQADDYALIVKQGERGSIYEVEINTASESLQMTAADCFASENPWNVEADPLYFTRREETYSTDPYTDIIWTVIDPVTQISATIRCVTVLNASDVAVSSRLNVESVLEPNPSFRTERTNLGGFCYTNDLEKTGTTNHTDTLTRCTNGEASDDAIIARVICENDAITASGVQNCKYAFCSQHQRPFFSDNDNPIATCVALLDEDLATGFCEALAIPSTGQTKAMANAECLNFIEDYGWDQAGRRYLANMNSELECVSSVDDLPESLSACEYGVELQILRNDEWESYLAFPTRLPVCEGVRFEFDCEEYPELFEYQWRFFQSTPNQQICSTNLCEADPGFEATVEYFEPPTAHPTTSPTSITPTSSPTECENTFCNKVYDSFECTPLPQFTGVPTDGTITQELRQMPECCAMKDTEDECDGQDDSETLSRFSQTCNPICDQDVSGYCCGDLKNADTLTFKVAFTGTERDGVCCDSCTCFGDPRCISFSGVKQAWIPCDARDTTQRWSNGVCRLSRDVCEEQKDPDGNNCVWDYSQGLADSSWDVSKLGSPCMSMVDSWLTMYKTVTENDHTFEFNLLQGAGGERGNIREARLIVDNVGYTISATTCLSSDMPFAPVPDFQYERVVLDDDVLLQFTEPKTNISLRIRCTATFTDDKVYMERLNVEELLEPDLGERKQVEGFCVENDMSRTGSTENTDLIEDGELCLATEDISNAAISKIICEPYLLRGDGVEDCVESLCHTYSWPHYSGKPENCISFFNELSDKWEKPFCRLWFEQGSRDFTECVETIREGQGSADTLSGWQQAAEKYIPVWSEGDCTSDADLFPTSLTKCQAGVTIQYEDGDGNWIDFRAFPVYGSVYPCPGGVTFKGNKHRALFVNPIRVEQKNLPASECFSVPPCTVTESVSTELTYERTTSCT